MNLKQFICFILLFVIIQHINAKQHILHKIKRNENDDLTDESISIF